ncbi:uncharacterized protein LOC126827084 isoform X3 [Patella vulgata]|uniref:uncharacterized protein LOC126827084 isoform X3 n=1 Tax=Patella vulgata TaxID=6465 RepID=UPI0024A7ED3E|nr:uncharacterized protein LOC126827084 isoform X3 [Patella vulgata]
MYYNSRGSPKGNSLEEKEKKIRHFEDMQNSFYPNYPIPETPTPDYDCDDNLDEKDAKALTFVRKFESVLSNAVIENIEIPEPAPDYNEDEGESFPPPPPPLDVEDNGNKDSLESKLNGHPPTAAMKPPPEDESPQIQPKKISNPCLQSRERQALHKELLLNYRRGVNVLQKPELNKILEKRKETQRHKEWEDQHQCNKRTSLELKLEERANKMKEEESQRMKSISEKSENAPEYLKMHARITHKAENKNKNVT